MPHFRFEPLSNRATVGFDLGREPPGFCYPIHPHVAWKLQAPRIGSPRLETGEGLPGIAGSVLVQVGESPDGRGDYGGGNPLHGVLHYIGAYEFQDRHVPACYQIGLHVSQGL